jgi:hypothetical protein
MRFRTLLAVGAFTLALGGMTPPAADAAGPCGPGPVSWSLWVPSRAPVAIEDVGYEPQTMFVAVGSTVVWTNVGRKPHTVTSTDGLFDSGVLAPGARYTRQFLQTGTFRYTSRGDNVTGFRGTIIVLPGAWAIRGGA